jgi:uncharacterized protein (TIGR02996 family)
MSTTTRITNSEADAFMRKYLAQPTDVTARLVFADWLEETCVPHNLAWAYYIRLKAETDYYDFDSCERRELDRQAEEYAPKIRANLTIPAELFVGYPKSLLQLLPAPNITVKLAGFVPEARARWLIANQIAQVYRVFPLAAQGDVLLIAHSDWESIEMICEDISNLLSISIIPIYAHHVDLSRALTLQYPVFGVPRHVHAVIF